MNFLFLCTGNSCRSILSEVLFNAKAPQGHKAYSAGSKPSGTVHPLTIKTLNRLGYSVEGLSSKSVDECEQYAPDVVITVCDQAASEPCPLYLGKAIKSHWGLSDPSHLDLPEDEKINEFIKTTEIINRRFDALFKFDLDTLSKDELSNLFSNIAKVM